MHCKLNKYWRWFDAPPVPATDPLYPWLTNRDSLTSRLRTICDEFQVIVHQSRPEKVSLDEAFLLSTDNDAQRVTPLVREVSLVCDEIPLVFGRSILMTRESGPLEQSFRHVGNNSLGTILFACPDIQRGPFHFKRIGRQHTLYAKSAAALDRTSSFFWARRSVFSLRSEQICVTEVFSPQLVMLSCPFRTAS